MGLRPDGGARHPAWMAASPAPGFTVRRAATADLPGFVDVRRQVAEEGKWIAAEPPIDVEAEIERFGAALDVSGKATFVAVDDAGVVIGGAGVTLASYGVSEFGMMVADGWRGRGVGSSLLRAIIEWSRENGAHKVSLQAWPHNDAAVGLYEKFGFRTEGRLRRHYRRRNGELWDAVLMSLVLDERAPGSPW